MNHINHIYHIRLDAIAEAEAELVIGVVVEVYNISTRELRRTSTVVGNVHYIEFNDAMDLKIQVRSNAHRW